MLDLCVIEAPGAGPVRLPRFFSFHRKIPENAEDFTDSFLQKLVPPSLDGHKLQTMAIGSVKREAFWIV
jgi:hypothetical protein